MVEQPLNKFLILFEKKKKEKEPKNKQNMRCFQIYALDDKVSTENIRWLFRHFEKGASSTHALVNWNYLKTLTI